MSLYVFKLPDVGEGVTDAELTAWHVKPGDRIDEDQLLADVMTDKATVEMTSPVAGIVRVVHGAIGDRVPVGSALVELEIAGDGDSDAKEVTPEERQTVDTRCASEANGHGEAVTALPPPGFSARRPPADAPLAAPATRRRAHELGVALEQVPGSGPGGRITPHDLERYVASRNGRVPSVVRPVVETYGITERKIIGLRRKIAERMEQASRRIPHFSYVEEFDMTALEALRADLNADRAPDQPKLTLLPFFMRALVLLRSEFPFINALYDDEAGILREYEAVHIGIATQTEDGLMVPVVRHAEMRSLWDCAQELQRVAAAAREGRASREELTGSTITLTSLGPLGGIAATPIINAPEVAIIGPNKLVDRPVARDGQIVIRTLMNLSSSFDHRIVDGHDAARFVQRLKRLIEQPAHLFLDASRSALPGTARQEGHL